jgi:SAM-dependent methyltransferase
MIECSAVACQREYPIVDGIPLLVADIQRNIGATLLHMLLRSDLDPATLSALNDAGGPESELDRLLRHWSHYGADHWGDQDPDPFPRTPRAAPVVGLWDRTLKVGFPLGTAIDLGCAVGRGTFHLASISSDLVLGLDLNFTMLRMAAQILRTGVARYPVRRLGMVYGWREHAVQVGSAQRVDFWMADAVALPFTSTSLGFVGSMNLIDCLADPGRHLLELGRVLAPGGILAMASPFDWAPHVTPVEAWIGGHSQRATDGGAAEPRLARLFEQEWIPGMHIKEIVPSLPWPVRVHDRATMTYDTHLLIAQKAG